MIERVLRRIRGAWRTGSAYTVALPLLALALAGALAYKAQDAAHSHRRTAERTLHDYADFAAWEYELRAQRNVLTALVSAFGLTMSRINPAFASDSLPTPAEFGTVARRFGHYCDCLGGVRFFFRYDWRDRTLMTSGERPGAEVLQWVRDTVSAHTRIFETPEGLAPLAYGGTSGGSIRRLSVVLTNDSYAVVFATVAGRERVLAYVLSRDYENRPVATYGFETDAAAFAAPLFRGAFENEALLPPSLGRGVPVDSVLAVRVRDLAGNTLYASAAELPRTYATADTMHATFGRAVVQVGLRPELAERLVVGGLPRSQLPLLLALFLLTAGLLVGSLLQLRRQQDLARLRTDFVSGVSHELRTPLTQIRLFAELLTTGAFRSDADRRRAARVVDQEARRLTYLVENVLNYSKSERRASRILRETTDVTGEVRDILDFFAPVARARAVQVTAAPSETIVAPVDRAALRQIMLNLLDNAVKYGPAGQVVTVAIWLDGPFLHLRVDDEGPGIPPAEREHIWEPYHRLERDATSAVGGSGIGLAVVHDLTVQHGGRAWVEDAPHPDAPPGASGGRGARFHVELSVADATGGAEAGPARARRARTRAGAPRAEAIG
ncbi:MAG: HAMP domain-containing sensor histidine kinase [Gemmatimonadaceae bacterium]